MSEKPRLTVLGTGYLGATHAICMAVLGYEVLGIDTDEAKVAALVRWPRSLLRTRLARDAAEGARLGAAPLQHRHRRGRRLR